MIEDNHVNSMNQGFQLLYERNSTFMSFIRGFILWIVVKS